ncbi:hypothetical protein KF840_15950 [bacterium]|nr:hypothetical protein [bacterium]
MASTRATPAAAQEQYWRRRFAAPAFRRALTATIADALRALARQRVGQVIDPVAVRELIDQWDLRIVDRPALTERAIAGARRSARRLAGRREALADLLDEGFLAEIETAIDAGLELGGGGRELLAALMERELVRGLFTDLIFTALVSFQRRANPLFGALAVRALEDQIKGFIGLFMPMLQAQAIAFAVDRANQRAVLDFARAVARQLLAAPIGGYAALAAGKTGASLATLLRHAAANDRLAELGRRAARIAWDDLFAEVKNRRLGELLRLDAHADWIAARAVAALLPLLASPGVLALIAAEVAAASAAGRPRSARR